MNYASRRRFAAAALRHLFRTRPWIGFCPVCRHRTSFFAVGDWAREDLKCLRCRSSSRQRAVADYISHSFPDLETLRVHEASPTAAALRFFRESGARYSWSCYSFDDSGQPVDPAATEDLESLSFPDASFDLFVSQDVFEHVNDPVRAFSEVARVLKPGGSHVFTVPWYPDRRTERAAETDGDRTTHFGAPEYHSDPFGHRGSLVFTRFGSDICRIIEEAGGMQTRVSESHDRRRGVVGDSLFVFHSRKPGMPENRS